MNPPLKENRATRCRRPAVILFALCLGALTYRPTSGATPPADAGQPQSGVGPPAKLQRFQSPLAFEPNRGQTNPRYKFISRGRRYDLLLAPDEALLRLRQGYAAGRTTRDPDAQRTADGTPVRARNAKPESRESTDTTRAVCIRMIGADPAARLAGLEEQPGKINYFTSNDPAKWRTNLTTFAKVKYQGVYPGVDLIYYGSGGRLEHDFILAPGIDPSIIRLSVSGADRVAVDGQGDLVMTVGGGEIRFQKPIIYQLRDGVRKTIQGGFVSERAGGEIGEFASQAERRGELAGPQQEDLQGLPPRHRNAGQGDDRPDHQRRVWFAVADYDRTLPLVIDPVLAYSTYLGGQDDDRASDIAVDNAGNSYVIGSTWSVNFPVVNPMQATNTTAEGYYDVFITKFDPAGTIVYSTYLGADYGFGVVVDAAGNACITGFAYRGGEFPHVNTPWSEAAGAFVAKLNTTGSGLIFSGLLGRDAGSSGRAIAVDSQGGIYIAGITSSISVTTWNAMQPAFAGGELDAFVAKIDATGSNILYSTYLGGSSADAACAIAVDQAGNAYVFGMTGSTDFPVTANAFQRTYGGGENDYFVAKINPTGSGLVYSTFLGGSGDDHQDLYYDSGGLALDADGHAYLTGATASSDFPTTTNALQAGPGFTFAAKLSADGARLVYSTYLGGPFLGRDIAVDAAGNAYVTGTAWGLDLPLRNPVQSQYGGGGSDAVVLKVDPDGANILYSTYLGGSGDERGMAIAVDGAGDAFVAGWTTSTNFPAANAAQPSYGGGGQGYHGFWNGDAFVAKLAADPDPTAPILLYAITTDTPGELEVGFSKPVSETTATLARNYAIDQGASVTAALLLSSKRVRLTVAPPLAASSDCVLTVTGVQDRALPVANTIVANTRLVVDSIVPGVAARSMFTNIAGNFIADLKASPKFPNQPDSVGYVSSFETPSDVAENYGVTLQALLLPPLSGEYLFYIASDDQGALFLSTDENPANKVRVAFEMQWNPSRYWTGPDRRDPNAPENRSLPIHLEAGREYYLEAVMKEAGGGDNLGVAWRIPQAPAIRDGDGPIPGKYLLAPRIDGRPIIAGPPQSSAVIEGDAAVFNVRVRGTPPLAFQWLRNGSPIPGATNDNYSVTSPFVSDDGATFAITVSNAFGSITSAAATLAVTADTTPPLLTGVRSVTLDRIEVVFSKPVSSATATVSANYSITWAGGSLAVNSASVTADPSRVILGTERLTELTEYALAVNGIRDSSAAGNPIAANSLRTFTPYFQNEFIGPFPSWADAKRDYGAAGDGTTDDTIALQAALDAVGQDNKPQVLYLPAGTYRITRRLVVAARLRSSVLGEDPASTTILWDGPQDGVMLWLNGWNYSRVGRLTFDGSGRALSGIDQRWDGAGGGVRAPSGNEYADLVFRDLQFGMRCGNPDYPNNDAEVAVLRCHFLRCRRAGAAITSANALDWRFWQCRFEDCGVGLTDNPEPDWGAGQYYAYDCVFLRSKTADMTTGNTSFFSERRNYSRGSRAFFRGDRFTGNHNLVTLQDNIILDCADRPIHQQNLGPLILIDNIIRVPDLWAGPVAGVGHDVNFQGDLFSIGNTFSSHNPFAVVGRLHAQDDMVVDRGTINSPEPELPPPPPNLRRPIIEVVRRANASTIQAAIDSAAKLGGQRPVVHLPNATYLISRTLTIPGGVDLQLVGDGGGTLLKWNGSGIGPVIRLLSPARATLRDLQVDGGGNLSLANGIVVEGADQPNGRVFMDQANTSTFNTGTSFGLNGLFVDRLDQTIVELRDFGQGSWTLSTDPDQVMTRVLGGRWRDTNDPGATSRVNIFAGSGGGLPLSFQVEAGGRLMAQDMWFEGAATRFAKLSDSGTLTLNAQFIAFYSESPLPAIELDDFRGRLTLVNVPFAASRLSIGGQGSQTQVLGIGTSGTLVDYFADESPQARVLRWNSRSALTLDRQIMIPDLNTNVDNEAAFVRSMLAQLRSEKPLPLTPIAPSATDLRLYRVSACGLVSIQLNSSRAVEIVRQPQAQTTGELQPAQFTVLAGGEAPYQYQWRRNGVALGGETNRILHLAAAALTDGGALYSVAISNAAGGVLSSDAVLAVIPDRTPPALLRARNVNLSNLELEFSKPLDAASVQPASFAISGGLPVMGAVLVGDGRSVLLTTGLQTEGTSFTVTMNGLRDRSAAGNAVPANTQATFTASSFQRGFLVREMFTDIPGTTLDDLLSRPKFPDSPNEVSFVTSFETPSGVGDNYGVRLAGYLAPPVTGEYLFYIASDDQGGLFLSTDENPANKVRIAFEPQWNPARNWLGLDRRDPAAPENRSQPTYLEAGNRYYVEALLKEGGGGDNLAVTWQIPGGDPVTANTLPISGDYLRIRREPVVAPIGDRAVKVGTRLSFTVSATDADLPRQALRFSLDPGAPAGASIDPVTGVFSWTPSPNQGSSTNPVSVRVTDSGTPPLSATNSFVVVVNTPASITRQPASQTVNPGVDVTFSVEAAGTPPLSYQWLFGGAAIAEATSPSLTLNSVSDANGGIYTVDVSNVVGKVTSDKAVLIVRQPPRITWSNPPAIVYGTALGNGQLNATAGVPGTFVYAPLPGAVLTAGESRTLTVTFTPTDTVHYTVATASVSMTVQQRALTVTRITAASKAYDGTTASTLTGTPTLSGLIGSDSVTVSGTATGVFLTKTVGNNKPLTVSGLSLGGADAGNYTLTQPTLTANITPAALAITGLTANSKVYDGTTAVTLTGTPTLSGLIGNDSVTVNGTATGVFLTKAVGNNKPVTVSGLSLGGADAGNYTPTQLHLTANITPAALAITGLTANSKVYDGTTAAILAGTPTLSGLVGSDSVTVSGTATGVFVTKAVGNNKPITVSGLSLGGADAGNYTLTQPTLTANITPAALVITGLTANSKVYDGTTAAILAGTPTLSGLIGSDSVTVSGTATGVFVTKAVGNNKPITVSGLSLGGADAGNYTLTQPTLTANITPAALVVTGLTANSKVYDGTTASTLTGTPTLSGLVGSDSAPVRGTATGVFLTKTVGNNKPLTVSGLSLGGADAGNYTLTQPTLTANITPAALTVTANDTNRVYGAANPVFTGTITGMQSGDSISATYSCAATDNSPVGTYPIVPHLVDPDDNLANYTVTTQNGLLTVISQQAGPTITNVSLSGSVFSVLVLTETGRNYVFECKNSLSDANWRVVRTLPGTGGVITLTDPTATDSSRFYRVRVEPSG